VVRLEPLHTCISCTGAGAGGEGSRADATALRVLGFDIAGGRTVSDVHGGGALLALPANPLVDLAVAHWAVDADATHDQSVARSRAALVDLALGNGSVATVSIFEAFSKARWDAPASHSHSTTNGVHLDLMKGALVVIVLHSESSSDQHGRTYVASINGTELLEQKDIGTMIPIEIPGLLRLDLLWVTATGGLGTAGVGSVSNVLGTTGEAGAVLATTASGASRVPSEVAATTGTAPTTPTTGATGKPAAGGALKVPSTGTSLGLLGFALFGGGLALLAVRRVRRSETAESVD
jgi:hypothetical protein